VHHEAGGSGADFDLSQFYQIFFEEAGENLDLMEQMLLNLNLETADDEELNEWHFSLCALGEGRGCNVWVLRCCRIDSPNGVAA
jgi:hypothetical protein